eukprot:31904_1
MTKSTISLVVPDLCSGVINGILILKKLVICSSVNSPDALIRLVGVNPGWMQLTRLLSLAYSNALNLVKLSIANLLTQYGVEEGTVRLGP